MQGLTGAASGQLTLDAQNRPDGLDEAVANLQRGHQQLLALLRQIEQPQDTAAVRHIPTLPSKYTPDLLSFVW